MTKENHWITLTQNFVREKFLHESTGHDFFHLQRVAGLATALQKKEGGNLFIIQMTAWLHDIADWKFAGGDSTKAPLAARQWMEKLEIPEISIAEVCKIIANLSFKGARVNEEPLSLEGMIVQDADRLDALGAIGIARTFAYGGHAGSVLYDPALPPTLHDNANDYLSKKSHSINHFHEKLLLLKDRMKTNTAKAWAKERHEFMEEFLNHFHREWRFATHAEMG